MKSKLIVALDVDSFEKAKKLIDKLAPHVDIFKVGSELFVTCGPKIIGYIKKRRKKAFLDLKFYDIPNAVKKATLAAAKHKIFMLTLHVKGGFEMLKEARSALKDKKTRPFLVGVTILTSKESATCAEEVTNLALTAQKAGLDGIVCSAKETRRVKEACGKNFVVVNPGIRPPPRPPRSGKWSGRDDQRRVATPEEAVKAGADFIVIGRPITQANDPVAAAEAIM